MIAARERAQHPRSEQRSSRLAGVAAFNWCSDSRYLLVIGLLTLTVQLVNTNGNFILNGTVREMADAAVRAGGGQTERQIILGTMAGVDFWQNLLSMAIQFFLVSRIFKYLGIGGALFVLPLIALGSYGLFALAPVLSMIRIAKITENATDYSLQNTVRRALFLPTSRDAKYKALQAVETFFWRAGDLLSSVAVVVFISLASPSTADVRRRQHPRRWQCGWRSPRSSRVRIAA